MSPSNTTSPQSPNFSPFHNLYSSSFPLPSQTTSRTTYFSETILPFNVPWSAEKSNRLNNKQADKYYDNINSDNSNNNHNLKHRKNHYANKYPDNFSNKFANEANSQRGKASQATNLSQFNNNYSHNNKYFNYKHSQNNNSMNPNDDYFSPKIHTKQLVSYFLIYFFNLVISMNKNKYFEMFQYLYIFKICIKN